MNVIEVINLSKKYNITHSTMGHVSLGDVLSNILKSPFGFIKHKTKELARAGLGEEEFWALKDVNFNLQKGETLGIIGRNGAGKSTLLKIISEITPPTEGEIRITGRVGSLLEAGTGFHFELSGRDNIFMSGAILGMKREEIIRRFDEIVAFAEVEKFLDTPVKHYSSGMMMRLAFSVVAHMEQEILIVDEVLSVGDDEFRKKCLNKMETIVRDAGRTIIFVSHEAEAVRRLCDKCLFLEKGRARFFGGTEEALRIYKEV